MIAVRVDANEHIALGHLMRCLSIADAFFSLGEDIIFFTSEKSAAELVSSRGYSSICLDNAWNDKDAELDGLIPFLRRYQTDLLLIDSYEVTPHYLEVLHEVTKTAYIDDNNAFDYPVDIVINYAIYANELVYPQNKVYLLGMDYVPLRKQFNIAEERLSSAINERKKNKKILITTGGSDEYHIAGDIISEILREPTLCDYGLMVIRGKFWKDSSISVLAMDNCDRIEVFENVENMADVMLRSALAVSAGGSTLYELIACCVPTVMFSCADNQLKNVRSLSDRGFMEYAGDVRDGGNIPRIVSRSLAKLHDDSVYAHSMIERMRMVDCRNGANHLAKDILVRL